MTTQRFLILSALLLATAACGGSSTQEGLAPPDSGGSGTGGSAGDDGVDDAGSDVQSGGAGGAGAGGVDGSGPSVDAGVPPTLCTSQAHWTNGDRGSAVMHPGGACITCHAASRSAPKFIIAGTIYPTSHEQNDCNGVNGAVGITVVVTDATGKQLAPITVNNVGNFYYPTAIASPFHVKVVSNGRENAMMAEPPTGDCNSCHTQEGANNAPGRILAP